MEKLPLLLILWTLLNSCCLITFSTCTYIWYLFIWFGVRWIPGCFAGWFYAGGTPVKPHWLPSRRSCWGRRRSYITSRLRFINLVHLTLWLSFCPWLCHLFRQIPEVFLWKYKKFKCMKNIFGWQNVHYGRNYTTLKCATREIMSTKVRPSQSSPSWSAQCSTRVPPPGI